jgi:hypothetical protein
MAAAGSLLERGIEAARTGGPTDEQLAALAATVLTGLGATTAALAHVAKSQVATAGWLSAGSAKLVVVLLATVAVGSGSVAIWHGTRPGSRTLRAASSPAHSSVATPVLKVQEIVTEKIPDPASEALAPALAPVRDHAQPAVKGETARVARAAASAPAQGTHDDEIPLLERANRALTGTPAQALALADEHQHRFPASVMDQEREIIAITALVRLGRAAEARERAVRLSHQHPNSVYQSRVDNILPPGRP